MKPTDAKYQTYIQILKQELCPAMGCTEPAALAYAAAEACRTLGSLPDRVEIGASGSFIKNVKSVIVPNTGHLRGLPASASAGIIAGDPDRRLQVISDVTPAQVKAIRQFLENTAFKVEHIDNGFTFEIQITLYSGTDAASVRIVNEHTNIVHIEKNGHVLKDIPVEAGQDTGADAYASLTLSDIWDFADTVELSDVREILDRQISCNMAIAEEGLRGSYGANIGSLLLKMNGNDVHTRARAMAAAGSDARMNGCEMPVVINSGSGNQGMTASIPVIVYAEELHAEKEKLYRALVLSNLVTIHQKTPIGRLSAYCGAVSAGVGAGAGIAYICGGDQEAVICTVSNAVSILSGTICDGAKASCAAKIAEAVDGGILGYQMYLQGKNFHGGDGLVADNIEQTLDNIGRLANRGMKQTNKEIIEMMITD